MTNYKASEQYAQTKIQTASGGDLVVMLYQGCIKFMRLAKKSMEEDNIHNTNEYLIRSQDIIMELLTTLDGEKGGEVATNLAALYEYMYRELIQANMKKDPEKIDQVESMMLELLEAWKEAVKQDRKENGRDRLDVMTGGR
ncbi:flagellar export chaperone FliS [Halanaerobiaceae bacterium Z-7014]|uniref:Flagellar secretion chaperone FliS n=1 Tax=Halonatronomonas betaini TaxID=2778430 RepID=A0A931F8L4_9FIRM|nr:flagellar export chaperone FliS [Halonatronomonas betaini]MBF8437861.1 flagellar export chaperone FliS [Halonatronomonas betaini]